MRRVVVSIHDLTPSSLGRAAEWREWLAARGAGPVSLLVVPRYGGRESWRAGPGAAWLRERAAEGDEIVLHGWAHVDREGRDGAELAGSDAHRAREVVRDGLAELRAIGLAPAGFIAPAYGGAPEAIGAACRALGLPWWASRLSLHLPERRLPLPSLGLGASSPVKRALSPAAARLAAAALARADAVRLDLHAADLLHHRLARAGRELLGRLLDQGRIATTHSALAGR